MKGKPTFQTVRNEEIDWYSKSFSSPEVGATWVLEVFPHLYKEALEEMKGKFTRGELHVILEVIGSNFAALSLGIDGLAGKYICLAISDSLRRYSASYEKRWGVDKGIVDKLVGLTRWQLVCLEIWGAAFWETHYRNTTPEKYCEPLES